jgi:hypothetical protein
MRRSHAVLCAAAGAAVAAGLLVWLLAEPPLGPAERPLVGRWSRVAKDAAGREFLIIMELRADRSVRQAAFHWPSGEPAGREALAGQWEVDGDRLAVDWDPRLGRLLARAFPPARWAGYRPSRQERTRIVAVGPTELTLDVGHETRKLRRYDGDLQLPKADHDPGK